MVNKDNQIVITNKKEDFLQYFIAIVIALIILLYFCYEDLKTYTAWTLNLLDVIYEMRIYDFYVEVAQNIHNVTVQYASGDIVGLIPWAVWNIPIWILQYFGGMDICDHPFMLVWSHLFLVVVLAFTFRLFIKVANHLSDDKNTIFLLGKLFLFSPFVYIAICYSGQTDILSAALFLLSLYMLFQGKRKRFYICAMIGYMIKPFFFLSHIAIILLEEKNILKILAKILCILSLNWAYSFIFWQAPMYQFSRRQGSTGRMIQEILGPGIDSVNGLTACSVIIGLIFVYFMSYVTKVEGKKKNQYIVYYSTLPLLVYFMLVEFEHYRLLIMALLAGMVILCKTEYLRTNIILLTIMNVSGMICNIAGDDYLFNNRYIKDSIFAQVISPWRALNYGGGLQSNLMNLIPHFDLVVIIASTVFVIVTVFFIILNKPEKVVFDKLQGNHVDKKLVWFNYFLIVPILLLSLYNV